MKIKFLGGRGVPLLMIHGWGVNSEIWVSLVDELKLFASVYLIDLPGMGGSSSISPYTLDNIAKEIKANVPIKKCNILGWSLGGQVAMSMAIRMPEIIEKLILMSTTPCFVEKKDWPQGVNNLDDSEEAMLNVTLEHGDIVDGLDILELGCGWGSLTCLMAKKFPNSKITAVSNSNDQRIFIMNKCERLGLENVDVITADMNDFNIDYQFDRVVSVEMFEHMRNYQELLKKIYD